MSDISAPGLNRGAVFGDGELRSQTAQKTPSLGGRIWRGQKDKYRLYKGKAWIHVKIIILILKILYLGLPLILRNPSISVIDNTFNEFVPFVFTDQPYSCCQQYNSFSIQTIDLFIEFAL